MREFSRDNGVEVAGRDQDWNRTLKSGAASFRGPSWNRNTSDKSRCKRPDRSRLHSAALFLIALASLLPRASAAAEEPRKSGLTETARVDLVQMEVTVWPRTPGSDACLGLTADDFELLVDGKPRPIYAVDAIGSAEDVYAPDAPASVKPASGGMALVLLFDLWHLDTFYRAFDACPRTKPLAFEEARRVVREEFHEGDRLLLVTFAGWPVIHYGWIFKREEALAALDRLEKNRQVMAPRQEHMHHVAWIDGIESLLLALGRYPGRKDVIYLGDDFRFDDVAMRMYEIAGRAQANGVVVSAVDLLDSCRGVPGWACPLGSPRPMGGLGCTPFTSPVALNPLSRDTGGELFKMAQIAPAVRALRSVRRCRYLVSFRKEPHEKKRAPSVKVNLKGERKDIALHAPSSFQTPEEAPSKGEQDQALFLLPRFGRGIGAEVGLWPYRPAGKRWQALVLARIERTDEEALPEELSEIRVDVLVHKQSHIYAAVRKKITGEDLKEFRATGRERLMVFPIEKVRSGEATVDLTVTADAEGVSANVRKFFTVPEPPEPGEARPWFLSDRFVRVGEAVLRVPSLDETVSPGEAGSVMGYACRANKRAAASYTGRLLPLAGGAGVAVTLGWVDPPRHLGDGCGWLVGAIPDSLPAGMWTFEPPADLGGGEGTPAVEFSVVSSAPPATLPAELAPK